MAITLLIVLEGLIIINKNKEVISLEDANKQNKETPKEPTDEIREETVKEEQPKIEMQDEETQDEHKTGEPIEKEEASEEPKTEEVTEETSKKEGEKKPKEPKSETKEVTEEPKKTEEKEKAKKKVDRGPDFKYIVRLSNTDVNGEKNIVYGLTSIKGIGVHMATLIADKTKIDRYKKIGYLSDAQIEKLQELINNVKKNAPDWMLNHQKDYETGENIHLVGSDIDMRLRDEINIMKKIRSYRGIRHERGLPVRGQRTRANSRTGLTLGVSKKKALSKSSGKKE
jgi:small subunit ribosomal protein S13